MFSIVRHFSLRSDSEGAKTAAELRPDTPHATLSPKEILTRICKAIGPAITPMLIPEKEIFLRVSPQIGNRAMLSGG